MRLSRKIAALDVGSNTVLMLVVEAAAQAGVRTLLDVARITRLGRGVDQSGMLDAEAARRTLDTIVEFVAEARALGAETVAAVATSALRDARDGGEFAERVRNRAGIDLDVISGATEAELSHLAVVRGLHLDPAGRILIADIGGGSTELIYAEPGRKLAAVSLQAGSVRLTERIIRHDPPTAEERAALGAEVDAALAGLGWNCRPETLVGIAGTVTTVCAVALEMETYDHARVHGRVLSRAEVSRTLERFGELPLAERKRLKGLAEGRADVIFAGAMILNRIMERFGAERVVVSDQGVRWGLLWREIDRLGGAQD